MAMWKNVKEELNQQDMDYLIDEENIPKEKIRWVKPRESAFFNKQKKIQKYLYNPLYKVRLGIAKIIHEFQFKRKSIVLAQLLFNVAITGYVIHLIETVGGWISYGLTVAMITYYVEWLVRLVKTKGEKKE